MAKPVRTFSPTRKLTAKWAVGGVAVIGAVAVTVGVAAHAGTDAEEDHAAQAAKKILHAADTYAASSAQAGCPTISELIESRALEESSRMEDAWGNRFRIVCSESGPRVVSAGRDGQMGTKDDLRFSR
jgi:NAD(P)H-dependent flavin oxidoreductase YrpB (nitropropane dioxygenase family)